MEQILLVQWCRKVEKKVQTKKKKLLHKTHQV